MMPAQHQFGVGVHVEAHLAPERGERLDVALRLVAEVEVVAFVHLARMQRVHQHLPREVVRRHQRQVAREWQHQHGIDAGLLQQLQLDLKRREQLGRNVGPQDAQRMRLEGHHHGLASDGVGALGHVPHHLLVRHVYAVEVADAHHGRAQLRGNFFKLAEDLHRRSAS